MAGERHGTAAWPGVPGVESCTYTACHGISPSIATMTCHPPLPGQPPPEMKGDLVFSDTIGTVTLKDCRVVECRGRQDGSGSVLTLSIEDRRWRWKGGAISGAFNQLDPHAKLIPWTIRSPKELAILCLQAMDEDRYDITALPEGLDFPGHHVRRPIINTSGVNPPVEWNAMPPAQALQQVAELFGCRVVFDPVTDRLLVARLGFGEPLPPGSLSSQSPSLRPVAVPSKVGVRGAPTMYQLRMPLEPVAEEWDGSYVPIDLVSYAPPAPPVVRHAWHLVVTLVAGDVGVAFAASVGATGDEPEEGGVDFTAVSTLSDLSADIAAQLVTAINASSHPKLRGKVKATQAGGTVVVEAIPPGYRFHCTARLDVGGAGGLLAEGNAFAATLVTIGQPAQAQRWRSSEDFVRAVATDRLTRMQAVELARKSIFRMFRVVNEDVSGTGPIRIPTFGGEDLRIERREQLLISGERVEQVVPAEGNVRIGDNRRQFEAYLEDHYGGYSRSKKAATFGSVARECFNFSGLAYIEALGNTPEGEQVFAGFNVNPTWQVITYDVPLFLRTPAGYAYPDLVFECACGVRSHETNELDCYEEYRVVPGGDPDAPPLVEVHEDVQANVITYYGADGTFEGAELLEADPEARADHYLRGMLAQLTPGRGQQADYNGIVEIELDGAVQQVTWSVGPGGAMTTASHGFEYNPFVPPYPARRRAEFLPPVYGGPQRRPLDLGGGGAF